MVYHAAYGLRLNELDVAIVDANRSGQHILRSLLSGLDIKRVRSFDSASAALREMQVSPPNMLLVDWLMEPVNGCELIHMIRHKNLKPLCFLPSILVADRASPIFIDQALKAGAHQVLIKPVSFEMISRRLNWLLSDDRQLVLNNSRFEIENVRQLIDACKERREFDDKVGELVSQIGNSEPVEDVSCKTTLTEAGIEAISEKRDSYGRYGVKRSKKQDRNRTARNTPQKTDLAKPDENRHSIGMDDIWLI